ncbi:MAG: PEP-CTERM sorting domain-containing protein [Phycisphaerae bacterium]|nr:PEP-CTERM sorting domain-containing protein [Phycisphaerae bacterium]
MRRVIAILAVAVSMFLINQARADCPLAHTHIGKNPTWRPADWGNPGEGYVDPITTDDTKLWFYSLPPAHAIAPTPGWPVWGDDPTQPGVPFLKLVPEEDPFGQPIYKNNDPQTGLKRYICSFKYSAAEGYGDPNGTIHLDGWHSAHGPQGAWNLADTGDPESAPQWDIRLVREGASVVDDNFFMKQGSNYFFEHDGDEHSLQKVFLGDATEPPNAWGIHEHMGFYFYLPADGSAEGGDPVTATFSAYDAGGLYDPSDDFVFRFEAIPEPATAGLLVLGAVVILRRRFLP